MPTQGLRQAGEHAGAALQAPIRVGTYVAVLIEGVDFRWTDEETIFGLTFFAADFVFYLNVAFLVDLEDVFGEFVFNLQIDLALYPQQA
jgi:hypothetical protein